MLKRANYTASPEQHKLDPADQKGTRSETSRSFRALKGIDGLSDVCGTVQHMATLLGAGCLSGNVCVIIIVVFTP